MYERRAPKTQRGPAPSPPCSRIVRALMVDSSAAPWKPDWSAGFDVSSSAAAAPSPKAAGRTPG